MVPIYSIDSVSASAVYTQTLAIGLPIRAVFSCNSYLFFPSFTSLVCVFTWGRSPKDASLSEIANLLLCVSVLCSSIPCDL